MQSVSRPQSRQHDPAPSRLTYRMHRLWLTPAFHRGLRLGLPVLLAGASVAWYVADAGRVAQITDAVAETRRAIEQRPELAAAVREVLSLRLPMSSFDMDLDAMRQKVLAFNAIADAQLRVRPGGVLAVEITERVPSVLWRHARGLSLLDAEGNMVAGTSGRGDWPDLPLVAGEGAEAAVPEALALIAAAGPVSDRLRGLVRMGGRRWDIVLDRNQRILLPEQDPVRTLERLLALAKGRQMLERDVTTVDFRNPRRPTLRLNRNAVIELRNIRDLESGDPLP